jgi:SAM-dependent methyltransferase
MNTSTTFEPALPLSSLAHSTSGEAIQRVLSTFPFPEYLESPAYDAVQSYKVLAGIAERYLAAGDQVLDFGCGPADKTALLQFMGMRCSAFDDWSDDWHASKRQAMELFIRNSGIDFHHDSEGWPFQPGTFDMVMAHHVMEHIHDSPKAILNSMLRACKPEGLLLLTVPNAVNIRKRIDVLCGKTNLPDFETYFQSQGSWRGHVREYVKDDLSKLANLMGLEIVELRSIHNMLQKVPALVRPIYRAFTCAFQGCRDSWLLLARKPAGWTARD